MGEHGEQEKNARNLNWIIIHAANLVRIAYWRTVQRQRYATIYWRKNTYSIFHTSVYIPFSFYIRSLSYLSLPLS
jgi:hypothetical protein